MRNRWADRGVLGRAKGIGGKWSRLIGAAAIALLVGGPLLGAGSGGEANAGGGDRTLWLHHTHTGQTARFTFMKNGRYDQAVLNQMNVFLADWRTKDVTKMDPKLFDLLWEVYQEVGATQPYNIVSSYRSPRTNAMLRKASSGVAENSQHMRGKAMDVFIPGVNLYKLRATAMKHQVGGVGYYPTSGSPFVHMDTGNVRAWPRMTRQQLAKVFPDGKTLHLPVDGKPLSDAGRQFAMAQWNKCHTVPCGRGEMIVPADDGIMVAALPGKDVAAPSLTPPMPALRPAALGSKAPVMALASAEDPAQRVVPTIAVTAPLPLYRPARLGGGETALAALDAPVPAAVDGTLQDAFAAAGAPFPAEKSQRMRLATHEAPLPDGAPTTALAALDTIETAPRARVLMSNPDGLVAAYAASNGAELKLRSLIGGAAQADIAIAAVPDLPMPASSGSGGSMFEATFGAVGQAARGDVARALAAIAHNRQPNQSITLAAFDLVAPEIDHVNETLVEPQPMTAGFWADLTEAEGDIEKGTQLGPFTGRMGFIAADAGVPVYDRFIVTPTPLLVAAL